MKVTVIKPDESVIYGGKIYAHGESFEVNDLVGQSLVERGYVAAEGEDVQEEEVHHDEAHLDEAQLRGMAYSALKKLAADMGVSAVGDKETLIARICAVEAECEAPSDVDEAPEAEEAADDMPVTDMPE